MYENNKTLEAYQQYKQIRSEATRMVSEFWKNIGKNLQR